MVGSDSGANGCPENSALIRQVKQYMRDWFLDKVIRVADPRVLLGEQPPVPAQGARGYIIGEKPRSGSPHVKGGAVAAGPLPAGCREPAGQGSPNRWRRRPIRDLLPPPAAVRDAAVREDLIAKPDETIAGSGKLSATKGAELRGKISMLPGLNRFLRVIPGRAAPSGQDQSQDQGRDSGASALVRLRGSFVIMRGQGAAGRLWPWLSTGRNSSVSWRRSTPRSPACSPWSLTACPGQPMPC